MKAFESYDSIKEENPLAQAAGRALIAEGRAAGPKARTFIHVNNRLEGNAIATIAAMIQPALSQRPAAASGITGAMAEPPGNSEPSRP